MENDENFKLIKYLHTSRGQHPVIGLATKLRYGYRRGGESFLVHLSDIAAAPNLFVSVEEPIARRVEPMPVAAPQRIQESAPPEPVMVTDDSVSALEKAVMAVRFDMQLLPGATSQVVKSLSEAALTNPEAILEAGVDGLEQVRYIGATKAKLIYGYVKDKFG
jgi:hypothetical protein